MAHPQTPAYLKSSAKADGLPCAPASAGRSLHSTTKSIGTAFAVDGMASMKQERPRPYTLHRPKGTAMLSAAQHLHTSSAPLQESSQLDTDTQGMTMTVIKALAIISLWLHSNMPGHHHTKEAAQGAATFVDVNGRRSVLDKR